MLLTAFDHGARGDGGPHIFPLLLLLLFGFLAFRFIRRRRGGGGNSHHHHSPLHTLRERFANGEIDREEFEHRKAVLEGSEVIPPPPSRPTSSGTATAPPPEASPDGSTPADDAPNDDVADED